MIANIAASAYATISMNLSRAEFDEVKILKIIFLIPIVLLSFNDTIYCTYYNLKLSIKSIKNLLHNTGRRLI